MSHPVLYSFRRCPYAMRARMAIAYTDVPVVLREILLRDKPQAMLEASPKGTVPVLVLPEAAVLEESLDIMLWAISQNDPAGWWPDDEAEFNKMLALIDETEAQFKPALDRYKYPERYDGIDVEAQWVRVVDFLEGLEQHLTAHPFLFSDRESLADVAIFPFIRQCMKVDEEKFLKLPYPRLIDWLDRHLESPWFSIAMQRFPVWDEQAADTIFPG